MSEKEARRKKAEDLVDQINALVEEHGEEKYFHFLRYKVVDFTLLKRLKIFAGFTALFAVLLVCLSVFVVSLVERYEGVALALKIIGVWPLVILFSLGFILTVYYFVRWFSYCDNPMEVSYSEDDIRDLERTLADIKIAVDNHDHKETRRS